MAAIHSLAARWPVADPAAVARHAFARVHLGDDPVVALFAAAIEACRGAARGEPEGELGAKLAALPEELRAVVLLRDVAGLPLASVAAVLDLPRSTVQARLHRGREEVVG